MWRVMTDGNVGRGFPTVMDTHCVLSLHYDCEMICRNKRTCMSRDVTSHVTCVLLI